MPQAVPVIASALIKIGVSKVIAIAIASFTMRLAVSFAASFIMKALQPKPRAMDQGVQLQIKIDAAYPREVCIGKFAAGGSLVFENVSGSNNEYLWRVIAISDSEIEEISEVRGGGEALTFDGDLHTGWRSCTSHYLAGSTKCLRMRIYKGTQAQTADADLIAAFPSMITANFRGRGVAYAIVRMQYSNEAWGGGGGEFIFVGKGAKCYDPRTETTVWTENPVLIGRQYLAGFENNGVRLMGVGATGDDLPDADYIAGANECDEAIALDGGGTEARYRAGGVINARESAREILTHLCAAMAGKHIDRGGELVLLPGVARTPVMDISEDQLLADAGMSYAAKVTANDRVNAIASTFVSPDDGWMEASLPPRKNAAAIVEDGQRYDTSRAYRMVYSKTQGQRLDEIILRLARKEGFLAFQAPLFAFEMTPGDWFTMTSPRWGNVQKTFEIEMLELAISSGLAGGQPSARCAITAREVASSCYDWDEATDEIADTPSGDLVVPPPLPPIFDDNDVLIGEVDGFDKGVFADLIAGTFVAAGGTEINTAPAVAADATWQDVDYIDVAVPAGGYVYFPMTFATFDDPVSNITAGIRIQESATDGSGASTLLSTTLFILGGDSPEWEAPSTWTAQATAPAVKGATRRFTLQINRTSGSGTAAISVGAAQFGAGVW